MSYLVAVLFTLVAAIVCLALDGIPAASTDSFGVLFLAATVSSAWYGGYRAGLLSTALGLVALVYLFFEPRYAFSVRRADDLTLLAAYVGTSLLGCWMCEHLHRARRRAEAAAAAAQAVSEHLQLAVQVGFADVFTWDIPTNKVWRLQGIPAALDSTGDTPDSFEDVLARTHPADRDVFHQRVREAINRPGSAYTNEYRLIRPDGSTRWIVEHGRVEIGSDGTPLRLIGLASDITSRKQAEELVRRSEERLRGYFDHAPASVAVFDREMRYLHANRRWLSDFGLGDQDLSGRSHYDVFPDIPARWREVHQRGLRGEVVGADEDRFDRRDGAVQWLRWEVRPWHVGTTDEVGGIIIYTEDLTRRKHDEQALRQSEARLQSAIAVARLSAYEWNPRTGAIQWDERLKAMWGLPPDAVINYEIFAAGVHPDDRDYVRTQVARCLDPKGDGVLEAEFRVIGINDRRERWVSARGQTLFDAERQPVHFVGTAQDVTERKQTEERLRYSEQLHRIAFDESPTGIVYIDTDGRFTKVNPAMCDITGYSAEQLLSLTVADITHPDDLTRDAELLAPYLRGEIPTYENDKRYVRADGDTCWVSVTARMVTDAEGRPLHSVGVIRDITERKRTEERLRDRELQLRMAIHASLSVVFVWDVQTDRVSRLQSSEPALPETDNVPDTFEAVAALVHPDDRAQFRRNIDDALASADGSYRSEYRIVRPDGVTRWLAEHGRIEFNAERRPVRLIGISQDVTQQKEAQLRLEEQRQQLHGIFEGAGVSVWLEDFTAVGAAVERLRGEGVVDFRAYLAAHPEFVRRAISMIRIIDVNPETVRMFGAEDKTQLLGSLAGTFTPQAELIFAEELVTLWDGGTGMAAEAVMRRLDGREIAVVFAIQFDPADLARVVVTLTDITERRRAEERQRLLSEASAVLLATEKPDDMLRGVFTRIAPHFGLDAYFNFMVDDSAALRLASCGGVTEEACRGLQRIEFGQAVCGSVAASRQAACAEHIQRSDDPKVQLVKSLGIRVYACHPLLSGDRLLGTLSFASRTRDQFDADEMGFLRTISQYVAVAYERFRLVEQLREADRRKDEFLATLAHELRNPLAPIRNGLEIMKLAGGDKTAVEQVRPMMERQLHHMTRLIDDLMDLSRISRGKIELQKTRMPLADAVRNAIDTSRPDIEAKRHELIVDMPAEPIHVEGDLTRLTQVFANLLINAAKFTGPGGRIHLSVDQQGGDVVVLVEDTGVGIPPHLLNRVFDMFAQVDRPLARSAGGLGIGLNIVKRLVELHGGSITAESGGHGMGSRFTVRLPVMPSSASQAQVRITRLQTPVAPRRILIVDDNVDAATSLAEVLRIMGNETQTAFDGVEGVASAEVFKPDAILMDIGMPKMNGYDAARQIRDQSWGRGIVMVACTGWGQREDKRKAIDAGFDLHMTKPIDPTAVEKILGDLKSVR